MWRRITGPVMVLLAMLWASGTAHADQVYIVRAGDTLWRISQRLGVRPADLAAVNHLSLDGTIHPGLRLSVPAPAPATDLGARPPEILGSARGPAVPSAAVRLAMTLVGRPYNWTGMGSNGFDCSGFVAHVFAAVGRPLPHSSFAQYELGMAVSRWALVPGDLVFFQTYSAGPSHVGIYAGDDRFIHASYSRGVVISSLTEPYFHERFVGGRRL